jgi:hypothetical protein
MTFSMELAAALLVPELLAELLELLLGGNSFLALSLRVI